MSNDNLVSRKMAMELLGISESTLNMLVKRGDLPVVEVGLRALRFSRVDLENFIATRRTRRQSAQESATQAATFSV